MEEELLEKELWEDHQRNGSVLLRIYRTWELMRIKFYIGTDFEGS